jgi:RNA polymerase sigma-70 factor (ECF subfamily)
MDRHNSDSTTGDLVTGLKAGHAHAYRELMRTYERRLFSFAFGYLRDTDEAMDAVQDTFLKVYRNIDSFKGNSAFTTWMYRITRNLCIDKLRRRKRANQTQYDESYRQMSNDPDRPVAVSTTAFQDPVTANLRQELRNKIFDALEGLGDRHREILLLRELEGLSYAEISEGLGIPIGTVMSRIFHARKKVQKDLSSYMNNETNKGVAHGH